jgi:hypothetical protein
MRQTQIKVEDQPPSIEGMGPLRCQLGEDDFVPLSFLDLGQGQTLLTYGYRAEMALATASSMICHTQSSPPAMQMHSDAPVFYALEDLMSHMRQPVDRNPAIITDTVTLANFHHSDLSKPLLPSTNDSEATYLPASQNPTAANENWIMDSHHTPPTLYPIMNPNQDQNAKSCHTDGILEMDFNSKHSFNSASLAANSDSSSLGTTNFGSGGPDPFLAWNTTADEWIYWD